MVGALPDLDMRQRDHGERDARGGSDLDGVAECNVLRNGKDWEINQAARDLSIFGTRKGLRGSGSSLLKAVWLLTV